MGYYSGKNEFDFLLKEYEVFDGKDVDFQFRRNFLSRILRRIHGMVYKSAGIRSFS